MLASADPQRPEDVLQELSNDLMSPYCPGRTIKSCPSKAARKLEDEILVKARAGESRDQIEQELVARFGTDIIGYRPPPLVLWGPIVIGVVALVLLFVVGRRWVRRSRPQRAASAAKGSPASGSEPTRAELDALDDALDETDAF